MPTYFIPHGGGPCFFMDWRLMGGPADTWDKLRDWLAALIGTLPARPTAILVVTGHWEEPVFTASAVAKPGMIFDYSGFPPHTYELSYPAPGSPELAARVVELLTAAGLPAKIDQNRGFDHGVFVPMLIVDPAAEIPVVSMSLKSDLNPEEHLLAGRALAALRDEGVLIVGSGMSYHNMRAFRTPSATKPSAVFDQWLTHVVSEEPAARWNDLAHWVQAPAGKESHPREEHLIPLMVVAGAADDEPGVRAFTDNVMAADISAFRFG
jgi:aromatic ring-opening dioxygenase catalytic subunit (LigB family)